MADVSDPKSYQYLQNNHCGFLNHRRMIVTDRPQGRNDYHISYVLDGEFEVVYEGQRYLLHRGDFVYYPPHAPQWYRDHPGTHRFWVHFTGFVVPQILAESQLSAGVHIAEESPYLEELLYRFVNEVRAHHSISSRNGLLLEIILELGKLSNRLPKKEGRLTPCMEYMHRQYQEELALDDLARLCHLSISRFMAVFKKELGMTPMQYVTRLRMGQARSLLLATELPVGEIANACGYADPLYFCRVFKRETGCSPSHFRVKSG